MSIYSRTMLVYGRMREKKIIMRKKKKKIKIKEKKEKENRIVVYEMQKKTVCSNNSRGIDLERSEGIGRLFLLDPGNIKFFFFFFLIIGERKKRITRIILVEVDRERYRKRFIESRFFSENLSQLQKKIGLDAFIRNCIRISITTLLIDLSVGFT